MSKKKKMYSAEFKTKVCIELLKGESTLNELSAKYQIAPASLSSWFKQFQERATEIFQKGKSAQEQENKELRQELALSQQKIGQLTIERDWLEKKSDEVFGQNGAHRTRFTHKS